MEWQPIETAPKDGTDVLLYGDGDYAAARWLKNGDGFAAWYDSTFGILEDPTHWMPLPNPPEA